MKALNQYFVCLGDQVFDWDIYSENQDINLHTEYFSSVMKAWEEASGKGGWTVYLTWDINRLPSYGDRVVAFVLGDEMAQKPRYTDYVAAVFKCYGAGPWLGVNQLLPFNYQKLLTVFQYFIARGLFVKSVVRARNVKLPAKKVKPGGQKIYPIPLGYANQVEVPFRSLEDRKHDVSFAGSVVHRQYGRFSPKKWFRTPKSHSRSKMVASLRAMSTAYPDVQVGLNITGSFSEIRTADPAEYSDLLMNTRISLVPRGASYETYRFFESLRAGCIIISEYLPPFWFYKNAPVITIADWRELDKKVLPLLDNRDVLNELQQKGLDWWQNYCSAHATGRFINSALTHPGAEANPVRITVSGTAANGHASVVNQAHNLV